MKQSLLLLFTLLFATLAPVYSADDNVKVDDAGKISLIVGETAIFVPVAPHGGSLGKIQTGDNCEMVDTDGPFDAFDAETGNWDDGYAITVKATKVGTSDVLIEIRDKDKTVIEKMTAHIVVTAK